MSYQDNPYPVSNQYCDCETPDLDHLTVGGHKMTEGFEVYCPNCDCRYWLISKGRGYKLLKK